VDSIRDHVISYMMEDVLEAILADEMPDDDEIRQYIEHVYCWGTEMDIVEPTERTMRTFEVEHLSRDWEINDEGATGEISQFRNQQVIRPLNRWIFDNVDATDPDGAILESVTLSEIPAIEDLVGENDWGDVARTFPNFEPAQWDDPLEETATAAIKASTIEYMASELGYTAESAEQASSEMVEIVDGTAIEFGSDDVESDDGPLKSVGGER